jgi:hypothetical protein
LSISFSVGARSVEGVKSGDGGGGGVALGYGGLAAPRTSNAAQTTVTMVGFMSKDGRAGLDGMDYGCPPSLDSVKAPDQFAVMPALCQTSPLSQRSRKN